MKIDINVLDDFLKVNDRVAFIDYTPEGERVKVTENVTTQNYQVTLYNQEGVIERARELKQINSTLLEEIENKHLNFLNSLI